MIISRTPLRVSFVGGGSDLPSYYRQFGGRVVSTTINKYIYITVNHLSEYFDCRYLLKYSKTEMCSSIDDINHPILREVIRRHGDDRRLEITSMADLPAGTGLGSSSSFTVGLLNAIYAYKGIYRSKTDLAKEASEIEIEILNEPIGKQDQYAAACGDLKVISFLKNESVLSDPVVCKPEIKLSLDQNLLMFYTGITRSASDILSDQKRSTELNPRTQNSIAFMVGQCNPFLDSLSREDSLSEIGYILHRAWIYKKSLVSSISSPLIDKYYDRALSAGALGGKLLGAGGGGCLLFYVEPKCQDKVKSVLSDLKEIKFNFENEGSKIIYIS